MASVDDHERWTTEDKKAKLDDVQIPRVVALSYGLMITNGSATDCHSGRISLSCEDTPKMCNDVGLAFVSQFVVGVEAVLLLYWCIVKIAFQQSSRALRECTLYVPQDSTVVHASQLITS